ncbi:MAG: hypothetical protein P8Y95_08265 [Gammaproteobacteria bacterium]|jgi:hypothetical protein
MSEAASLDPKPRELDLSWMKQHGEWNTRAQPKNPDDGITMADIQIGAYGEVPDESHNLSGRPRGAAERENAFRIGGYQLRTKHDIWLQNAAWLYEEALQRQWSSATDIPWETIKPLPDDIEQAECQLATFLTEVEFVAGDVPCKWLSKASPDYFEARTLLLAQVMDESRHMDVFRKRAFANGGGLMQRLGGTAGVVGSIDMAADFNEMSSRLHLSGEGAVLTIFRMGELMAYNDAEKYIYRLCAQDEARHVAFGVMHMRYVSETAPERKEEIHCYLDESERGGIFGSPAGGGAPDRQPTNQAIGQNPAAGGASGEALAILLGGGKDKFDDGFRKLLAIRQKQAVEYIKRVRACGFGERFDNGRAPERLCRMAETI